MFTVLKGGYAEAVPGNPYRHEEVRRENEIAIGKINSLSVGFEVCAVTGASRSSGGYRELQPPVCADEFAALVKDLKAAKEEMIANLFQRECSAEVLGFHLK